MKLFSLVAAIAVIAAMNFSTANASVVASYDFTAGSAVSIDTSPFSIASNYDPSGGGNLTAFASSVSTASEHAFIRSTATPNSSNPTSPNNAYHSFQITVAGLGPNQTLDLDSLDFDYFHSGFNNNNIFAGVYSSLVGLTGTDDRLGLGTGINQVNVEAELLSFSIGLTPGTAAGAPNFAGTEFVGLTNGDIVDFRIQFGDSRNDNNDIQRIDNVVLNGTVVTAVVPEPASATILALGMFGMLTRRKRS